MAYHQAAARYRLADLVGGEEGAALRAAAQAWADTEAIAEPVRMYEIALPGFPPA
jgi:hypothetical protein